VTLTRTELFWLAYLWLLDRHRIELARQLTLLMDRNYAEIGEKLHRIITRPSPLLEKLR
jgi:hypothetical protein